jgi:opine dehydrogenase
LVAWASVGDAVGVETPMMDALIDLGSVIMGKDCRKEGRNLDHMGLKGMDLQQIKTFLDEGENGNDE